MPRLQQTSPPKVLFTNIQQTNKSVKGFVYKHRANVEQLIRLVKQTTKIFGLAAMVLSLPLLTNETSGPSYPPLRTSS